MKNNRLVFIGGALAVGALLFPRLALATTATNLSSFEGREEPTVIYYPQTDTFQTDDFVNMTDQGNNTVRMFLRYRANDWWDGDRSTSNKDRQRAEVKGLGVHQKVGETFEYITTWRSNPEFRGSGKFCHFFQLKGTDGDNGAPLVVASIFSGQSNAAVRYWPGNADTFIVARDFNWAPATWQTLKIQITTSAEGSDTGAVLASVDGDALQGTTGVQVYRPQSTDYRPKWGFYRGVGSNDPVGDDYIEHQNVTANQLGIPPPPPDPGISFEAELLNSTPYGATEAVQSDSKSSAGKWMALLADGAGDYIEYQIPSIPAGTYDLIMKYKGHPSRGILSLEIDGVPLGPTLDQYSSTQVYPDLDFGTVRFASAGTHVIRLTCLGKNPASGAYTLSADKFTFLPDTTPPVIDVPDDLVVEATGPSGAVVTYAASATDDKDGDVAVTLNPVSGSVFPLGDTTVTATAADSAGNTASESFVVSVVDTTPPALNLPTNLTLEATSPAGAVAAFAVSATDLVSGSVPVTVSQASGSTFPLGTTTVDVSAQDAAGNSATGSFTVTVVDTTPPVIHSLRATPDILWPANHKMIPVTLVANVSDNADPSPLFHILSVSSNEPVLGTGSGDTSPDWVITGPGTVNLRAERAGNGSGRIYTITVECRDQSGNATTRTVQVTVPKSGLAALIQLLREWFPF